MKKEGGNDFPPFSFHLTHAFHLFADDGQCRRVRGEDRVQPLRLLGWVVGIVVAYLPLLVLRTGKTAPPPEVAAGKESALLGIVSHQREDIAVVAVASCGGTACREREAVARITELLHHERLAQTLTNGQMLVNILLGILAGTRQVFNQRIRLRPAPVVRPQVDVAVVYVLVGTDAFPTSEVVLTPPGTLTANRNEVVGIQFADDSRRLAEPFFEGRQRIRREGSRLVANLPRHDGTTSPP